MSVVWGGGREGGRFMAQGSRGYALWSGDGDDDFLSSCVLNGFSFL